MRFLEAKSGTLLCFINGFWYCCYGIYILETSNSVTNCIITVPDCGLQNGTQLSCFMNYSLCSAHFSWGKKLYFQLKNCVFQYITHSKVKEKLSQ